MLFLVKGIGRPETEHMNQHTVTELDDKTRYRLLDDEQRRFVIESLQTVRSGVDTTLDDVATHLERTAERTGRKDADPRRTLRCRLHHVHLPMLADAGLLEYDAETKRVRLGGPWSAAGTAESS